MVEKESINGILLKTQNDLSYVLLYTHTCIYNNTKKTMEAGVFKIKGNFLNGKEVQWPLISGQKIYVKTLGPL